MTKSVRNLIIYAATAAIIVFANTSRTLTLLHSALCLENKETVYEHILMDKALACSFCYSNANLSIAVFTSFYAQDITSQKPVSSDLQAKFPL